MRGGGYRRKWGSALQPNPRRLPLMQVSRAQWPAAYNFAIVFLVEAAGGAEKAEDRGQKIMLCWLLGGRERKKEKNGRGCGGFQRREGENSGRRKNEMPASSFRFLLVHTYLSLDISDNLCCVSESSQMKYHWENKFIKHIAFSKSCFTHLDMILVCGIIKLKQTR